MDIKEIIRIAGGTITLSKACNIAPQAVSQWKKVPAIRVKIVSMKTGLSPSVIRPDIFGA